MLVCKLSRSASFACSLCYLCSSFSQPFDLTDLDWSPQLWIACHDDDEQNARLANHVWEDNGLEVPEDFFDKLMNYLGMPFMFLHLEC